MSSSLVKLFNPINNLTMASYIITVILIIWGITIYIGYPTKIICSENNGPQLMFTMEGFERLKTASRISIDLPVMGAVRGQ